LSVSLVQT